MDSKSYAKSLEGVLKTARETELDPPKDVVYSDRDEMLRAAALVAVISMLNVTDERSQRGRQLGQPWSHDHRRTRMGQTNVMEHRRKRSTWR